MGWQFPIFNKCTHPFLSPSLLHALDELTPRPPLCFAKRGTGGEFIRIRKILGSKFKNVPKVADLS